MPEGSGQAPLAGSHLLALSPFPSIGAVSQRFTALNWTDLFGVVPADQ